MPDSTATSRTPLGVALACLLAAVGCSATGESASVPAPSGDRFAQDVYPVLLRDCGMSACHGSENRFFRIFGPGRTRLSATTDLLAPATAQELLVSYNRARALLQAPPHVRDSLLLRKPLAREAGGMAHEGSDAYGRNVYLDTRAPGYVTLATWADTAGAEPVP